MDFPSYFRSLFESMTLAEISAATGIDLSNVAKLLKAVRPPSAENLLRIACASGRHPAEVFEIAGWGELSEMMHATAWDEKSARPHPWQAADSAFHQRVQTLLDLGLRSELEGAVTHLETWRSLREGFEVFAKEVSRAAALAVTVRDRPPVVLLSWNCPPELPDEGEEGWETFSQRGERLTLILALNTPVEGAKASASLALNFWAATLRIGGAGGVEGRSRA